MVVHIRRLSLFGLFLAATAAVPPSAVRGAAADDDAGPLLAAVRAADADGRLEQSHEVGFTLGKKQFRDAPDEAGFLTGLDIGLGKFMDIENIYAVRANYWTRQGDVRLQEHGRFRDKRLPNGKVIKTKVLHTVHIQARPGYAVGGLTVRAGLNINGLSVTFMKIDGASLDPTRSYVSEWVGDRTGGSESVLDGNGAPVAALFGSQDDEKATALGLIFAPAAAAPPAAVQPAEPPLNPPPRAAAPPRRTGESPRREADLPRRNIPEEAPPLAPPEVQSDPVAAEPPANSKNTVVPAAAESWPLWASVGIPAAIFVVVAGACFLAMLIPFGRQKPQVRRSATGQRGGVRPRKTAADSSSALVAEPRRTPRRRPALNEKEVIELREEDYLPALPAADQPILDALPADK